MWTQRYQDWVKEQVHFEQPAQEYTLLDYLHEVEHMTDRIRRLEQAIGEAIKLAPPRMQEVIQGLASTARNRADLGGDDRGRVRGDLAVRQGPDN